MGYKKGVSPLTATMLLVLASVSLGVIVVALGESFIGENASFAIGDPEVGFGCEIVSFSVTTIRGVEHVCLKDETIDVSVDNGASTIIDDFHAKIHGSEGTSNTQNLLVKPLGKTDGVRLKIPYKNIGTPLKFVLTPIKKIGNNFFYCKEKSVEVENIPKCE